MTNRINTVRKNSHNLIGTIVGWVTLPLFWVFSFTGHLLKALLDSGSVIFGAFLMAWSFYLSTENYWAIFNKGSLAKALSSFWNNPYIIISVIVAALIAGLVEYIQSNGFAELRKQKELEGVVSGNVRTQKTPVILGLTATVLEGVAMVVGFWSRGGVTPWNLVLTFVALAGFKIGMDWISKVGGR
jgi:hypothetical protein